MSLDNWMKQYPEAAAALIDSVNNNINDTGVKGSEAAAQQQVRFKLAQAGAMGWRNNVGATPSRCPDCGAQRVPVRYGLANESSKLNERIKSSDIIAAIPRTITPDMVGSVIAQFAAIEVKPEGWTFTGKGREAAQARFLMMIADLGGHAEFSTGDINI